MREECNICAETFDSYDMTCLCDKCVDDYTEGVKEKVRKEQLLCAGWRSIKDDTTYKKESRVLIFSPKYTTDLEMRIIICDAKFAHLLTEATHWKKLDEPTGI